MASKKNKINYNKLSKEALVKELAQLKKEQLSLRFMKANGQLDKTSIVRTVRRDIARVKTFLNKAV